MLGTTAVMLQPAESSEQWVGYASLYAWYETRVQFLSQSVKKQDPGFPAVDVEMTDLINWL